MKKRLKIDGEIFGYVGHYDLKSAAKRSAQRMRDRGKKARVRRIPAGTLRDQRKVVYGVWAKTMTTGR